MPSKQRIVWGLVLGLATACAASAQSNGALRWRGGAEPLGLQSSGWRVPCGSVAFPCEGGSVVPLYASRLAPRSLSMQIAAQDAQGMGRSPLNFSFVGKAGFAPDLGVYGRIGAITPRPVPGWAGEPGLTYGVGLSWDFSRRGSAIVGWDSYDLRTAGGESRDVRATSLGLQWRY
jgi:OmpA-OmpF porin, OOP family